MHTPYQDPSQHQQQQYFDPYTQFNPLPEFTPELTVPGWTAAPQQQTPFASAPIQSQFNNFGNHPVFDPNNAAYPFPASFDANMNNNPYMNQHHESWDMDAGAFGPGLNQMQQEELMQSLETDGMEDIQSMISSTLAAITPKAPQNPTF